MFSLHYCAERSGRKGIEWDCHGKNSRQKMSFFIIIYIDGAEGDYYPYTVRTAAVYTNKSKHSGKYSIQLNDGSLELSIYLTQEAELSLWYRSVEFINGNSIQLSYLKDKIQFDLRVRGMHNHISTTSSSFTRTEKQILSQQAQD